MNLPDSLLENPIIFIFYFVLRRRNFHLLLTIINWVFMFCLTPLLSSEFKDPEMAYIVFQIYTFSTDIFLLASDTMCFASSHKSNMAVFPLRASVLRVFVRKVPSTFCLMG